MATLVLANLVDAEGVYADMLAILILVPAMVHGILPIAMSFIARLCSDTPISSEKIRDIWASHIVTHRNAERHMYAFTD